jgi:hypothetical protein
MDLFQCFDRSYIINLPERRDRRRDMEKQLELSGLASPDRIEFFPGIRPATWEGWPNAGVRGCFLSHLAVLRQALDLNLQSVAILEDDCQFAPHFASLGEHFARELVSRDWDMAYPGHYEPCPSDGPVELRECTGAVRTTHFYAVRGSVLSRLVDYLEAAAARPAGHPLGGPQHYDGALSMFRRHNPGVVTLLAFPSLARQRNSRSDLTPRWFDRVPALGVTVDALRRLTNRG